METTTIYPFCWVLTEFREISKLSFESLNCTFILGKIIENYIWDEFVKNNPESNTLVIIFEFSPLYLQFKLNGILEASPNLAYIWNM